MQTIEMAKVKQVYQQNPPSQSTSQTKTLCKMFTQNKSIFNTNTQQQPQGSIFGGQQQQQGTNIFNQQQGSNMFTGNQQTTNPFGGNQQQNIFGGNQQNQQRPLFGNQQQQGNNLFQNTQQQPQQQGNNIFANTQQTSNPFGGNQQPQGNNIFGNNQQTGNPFGGQQQQPQQQQNVFGNYQLQQQPQQPLLHTNWNTNVSQTQDVRQRIQECCKRVDPRHLEYIKLDEMNIYKNTRLSELPVEFKNSLGVIMNNMKELRSFVDKIKQENESLNRELEKYCTSVRLKLLTYKEVLVQNIQQSNLLEEVRSEVDLIHNQVQKVIIPMYNNPNQTFDSPDEFSSTVARNILEKMIELNNKVDEIISCQNDSEQMSEQDSNTLAVLEHLLSYYENVSTKVFEFKERYNAVKKIQIEKSRRHDTYQEVMMRIDNKVKAKMNKDFNSYDLLKEIEEILDRREKKEKELKESSRSELPFMRYNQNYSQGWDRYGKIA